MTAPEGRYRDRYFTVPDGVRLHFRDYAGSADCPPLLCLPGLTRNARDFAHLKREEEHVMSHPFMAHRIRALQAWTLSDAYRFLFGN